MKYYKVVLKKVVHEIVNWFHLIQNENQNLCFGSNASGVCVRGTRCVRCSVSELGIHNFIGLSKITFISLCCFHCLLCILFILSMAFNHHELTTKSSLLLSPQNLVSG